MFVFFFIVFCGFVESQTVEIEGIPIDAIPLLGWTEGVGTTDGTTRDYINRAVHLEWRNYLGDWVDSAGTLMGDVAFSSTELVDDNVPEWIEWTGLGSIVQKWIDKDAVNNGFFLKGVAGSGSYDFHSRYYSETSLHPELVITPKDDDPITLKASADTYLEPSTYQGQGQNEKLRITDITPILVKFDFSSLEDQDLEVESATLRIYTFAEYGTQLTVDVYRVALADYTKPTIEVGLAKDFEDDIGIGNSSHVFFASGFEKDTWGEEWSSGGANPNLDTTDSDESNKLLQFRNSGKSLRVLMPSGENLGLSLSYDFQEKQGSEPEEIYFRYYLRFTDSWTTAPTDGGKMPGIAGTYGIDGWGGRKSDGTGGWSSRGTFLGPPVPEGNPYHGYIAMGNYVYHADMEGTYGDVFVWKINALGFLKVNTWYSVEQYLKMNTPGVTDGIMKSWIDGKLAFEKYDMRWRLVDTLKIENIWMNIYHGGTDPISADCYNFIDNVVIADSYIGPIYPPIKNEEYPSDDDDDDNDDDNKAAKIAAGIIIPVLLLIVLAIIIGVIVTIITIAFSKKKRKIPLNYDEELSRE